jgi:hypothetical protein
LQIFTADEPEVEALPRKDGYLEHIITDLKEEGADFHDKLAEIYLEKAKTAMKKETSECSFRHYWMGLKVRCKTGGIWDAARLLEQLDTVQVI